MDIRPKRRELRRQFAAAIAAAVAASAAVAAAGFRRHCAQYNLLRLTFVLASGPGLAFGPLSAVLHKDAGSNWAQLGLIPGGQIHWLISGTVSGAAAVKLKRRMDYGSCKTVWSAAWTIALYARLVDSDWYIERES